MESLSADRKGIMHKTYLGDSVYAEFDEGGRIVLTTENGGPPSNRIVLEPDVLIALGEYGQWCIREFKARLGGQE